MGPLWYHYGTTMGPLWDHYGTTMGPLFSIWHIFGIFFGIFLGDLLFPGRGRQATFTDTKSQLTTWRPAGHERLALKKRSTMTQKDLTFVRPTGHKQLALKKSSFLALSFDPKRVPVCQNRFWYDLLLPSGRLVDPRAKRFF